MLVQCRVTTLLRKTIHQQTWPTLQTCSNPQINVLNLSLGNGLPFLIGSGKKIFQLHDHNENKLIYIMYGWCIMEYGKVSSTTTLVIYVKEIALIIQGFWYFAQSQSRKFEVNPRNPAEFTKTCKIVRNSLKWYQIHVGTTYLKLILAVGVVYLPKTCKFMVQLLSLQRVNNWRS